MARRRHLRKKPKLPKKELFAGEFALAARAGLGVPYLRRILRHGKATVWASEKLARLTGEPEERFLFGPMWGRATAPNPARDLQVVARQPRPAHK